MDRLQSTYSMPPESRDTTNTTNVKIGSRLKMTKLELQITKKRNTLVTLRDIVLGLKLKQNNKSKLTKDNY